MPCCNSVVRSFGHSFIYSFVRSFVHLFDQLFSCLVLCLFDVDAIACLPPSNCSVDPYRIVSYGVIWCRNVSCSIVSYDVVWCGVM